MAPIQFGILMIRFQAIDVVGPLDILSSCSKATTAPLEAAGLPGFSGLTDKAIDIKFHHISTTMDPVELFTAGVRVLPTTTLNTCPPLDILLIGGPDPLTFKLDERVSDFVRAHVEAGRTLFTICTGAWAIAPTGLLDGKNATTNHGVVDLAKQQYPKVNWTKEKQWVVDGNIWTAGGACAGMDMVAAWVIQNYGMDIAKMGFYALDFEPRDVDGNRVLPQQHGVAAT
jgi:transcriptional regulator GlxA family with amidase domain